jgi:hypothetical protein
MMETTMRVRRLGGGIVHRRENGDRMGLNVTELRTGELALAGGDWAAGLVAADERPRGRGGIRRRR